MVIPHWILLAKQCAILAESPTFYHCVAFHIPVWPGVSHNLHAMPNILAQVMLKPLLIIQYVRLIQTVNPCQGPQFCYLKLSISDQTIKKKNFFYFFSLYHQIH